MAALLMQAAEPGMLRLKPREDGQGFRDAAAGAQIDGLAQ